MTKFMEFLLDNAIFLGLLWFLLVLFLGTWFFMPEGTLPDIQRLAGIIRIAAGGALVGTLVTAIWANTPHATRRPR